jgi:hypothetical protein
MNWTNPGADLDKEEESKGEMLLHAFQLERIKLWHYLSHPEGVTFGAGSGKVVLIIVDLCQVRATENYIDIQTWWVEKCEHGSWPLWETEKLVWAEEKAKWGPKVSVKPRRKSVVKDQAN